MTATTATPVTAPTSSIFAGLGALGAKERIEWRRGRRAWVVLLVSGLFMTLSAMNGWIVASLAPLQPEPVPIPSQDPLLNLAAAVSSQIFVIVAVFATMSLIVLERESGTLSWTASKPVSRGAIWLSKWLTASGILWVLGGLVPLAASLGVVAALYGPPPFAAAGIMAIGIGMMLALVVAISLAAATLLRSQAAVAAVTFAAIFLPEIVGGIVPIKEYFPTTILQWSLVTSVGQPAGIATPIAWALGTLALVAFSVRRMERIEL